VPVKISAQGLTSALSANPKKMLTTPKAAANLAQKKINSSTKTVAVNKD